MIPSLTITITKTADGKSEYAQICTPAAAPINIVLIAHEIILDDRRAPLPSAKKKKP